jgi:hypothetical protein
LKPSEYYERSASYSSVAITRTIDAGAAQDFDIFRGFSLSQFMSGMGQNIASQTKYRAQSDLAIDHAYDLTKAGTYTNRAREFAQTYLDAVKYQTDNENSIRNAIATTYQLEAAAIERTKVKAAMPDKLRDKAAELYEYTLKLYHGNEEAFLAMFTLKRFDKGKLFETWNCNNPANPETQVWCKTIGNKDAYQKLLDSMKETDPLKKRRDELEAKKIAGTATEEELKELDSLIKKIAEIEAAKAKAAAAKAAAAAAQRTAQAAAARAWAMIRTAMAKLRDAYAKLAAANALVKAAEAKMALAKAQMVIAQAKVATAQADAAKAKAEADKAMAEADKAMKDAEAARKQAEDIMRSLLGMFKGVDPSKVVFNYDNLLPTLSLPGDNYIMPNLNT